MENMDNELTDREFYNLKNGVMHEHFKDFTYNGVKIVSMRKGATKR